MADKKISELVALTAVAETDVLAVVDVSATETKKSTKAVLLAPITANGTNVGINTASPSARLDVHGDALGGTAGNASNIFEAYHSNGNGSFLSIRGVRISTGASWLTAATRIEHKTDGATQGYIQFNGDSDSATTFGYNGVEKMRMKSGGAFGIGTNSPTASLDVNGSFKLNAGSHPIGTANIVIGASAGYAMTADAGNNVAVGQNSMRFVTAGDENTAVGQLSLYSNVTGNGNTAVGKSALYFNTGVNNTSIGWKAGNTATSGSNNSFLGYNAQPSSVTVSNEITLGHNTVSTLRCQVTSITALSDMRDKTDITDLDLGLDYINALRPVEFVWAMRDAEDDNPRQGTKEAGFIAQELRSAEDQFDASWLGTVLDTNPDRLEASPGKLLPIVIKALQEASAKIDELTARIATLEGN